MNVSQQKVEKGHFGPHFHFHNFVDIIVHLVLLLALKQKFQFVIFQI